MKADKRDLSISVAHFLPRSVVNGPGVRSVLWVQGCPFRCPGCFNTAFQEFRETNLYSVDTIAEWIVSDKETEGVTFSGGEPCAHAEGLAVLAEMIQRAGKSVVLFTGYTKQALLNSGHPFQKKLMQNTDLIIAGPYKQDMPGKHLLLSSANQELVYTSPRYRGYEFGRPGRRVEYVIKKDGEVSVTGLPG